MDDMPRQILIVLLSTYLSWAGPIQVHFVEKAHAAFTSNEWLNAEVIVVY